MPDPHRVAKRINARRAPTTHPHSARRPAATSTGPGMVGSPPRAAPRCPAAWWREVAGELEGHRSGALPGRHRDGDPDVHQTAPLRSKDAGCLILHAERRLACVPCPGRCHRTHPTPLAMSPRALHASACHRTWPAPLAMLPHVSCSWKVSPYVTPECVTAQPAGTDGSGEPGAGI